jgi:hypothetical protein
MEFKNVNANGDSNVTSNLINVNSFNFESCLKLSFKMNIICYFLFKKCHDCPKK